MIYDCLNSIFLVSLIGNASNGKKLSVRPNRSGLYGYNVPIALDIYTYLTFSEIQQPSWTSIHKEVKVC